MTANSTVNERRNPIEVLNFHLHRTSKIQRYFESTMMRPVSLSRLSRVYPFSFISARDLGHNAIVILTHDWDSPRDTLVRNASLRILKNVSFLRDPLKGEMGISPSRGTLVGLFESQCGIKSSFFVRLPVANSRSNSRRLDAIRKIGHDVYPHPDPSMDYEHVAHMTRFYRSKFGDAKAMRFHTITFPQGLNSTYHLMARLGVTISSNLGFSNAVGFPAGMAYAFRIPTLKIVEVPIVFMDVTLWRDYGYDYYTSSRLLEALIKTTAVARGIVALIFHVEYMHDKMVLALLRDVMRFCSRFSVSLLSFGELIEAGLLG